MNKYRSQSTMSMEVILNLLGKFFGCTYDDAQLIITIPFVGYTITIQVNFES